MGLALLGALVCTLLASGEPLSVENADSPLVWVFDAEAPGSLPKDFVIGTLFDGRPAGDWKIVQTEKAQSGKHVLAQLQGKGAEHAYKVVLIQGTESSDFELTVSFLVIDGKADMGGGLIWRATDDRNYYLTRANPLEQNIRLYRVDKGVRHMLKNFDQIIDTKKWHTLRVQATGCRFQVRYDDIPVFDVCDTHYAKGTVGLWTKSDAITYFDDLQVSKH
ncbi:MAG: hypothetical protein CV089_19745 [Nitrospira sp. WS110]|nr:hypothetical protein [Nitrospira sp. WS110]